MVFQELPASQALSVAKRTARVRFFDRVQWLRIALVSALITGLVFFTYLRSLGAGHQVEHARAMALACLTAASAGITASLSRLRTRVSRIMVAVTLGTSLLFIQVPALARLLHLSSLHVDDWAFALGGALLLGVPSFFQGSFRRALEARRR